MPLCGRCPKPVPMGGSIVLPPEENETLLRKRTCIGCGREYDASGNHQVRCQSCGEKHAQAKNAAYQAEHRSKLKGKP